VNLNLWAQKWGVSLEALDDLRRLMGAVNTDPNPATAGESESEIMVRVRLEASRVGARLARNNVGAIPSKLKHTCPKCHAYIEVPQRPMRFGLFNDSQKMNETIKSSDLIGIRSELITPNMVGHIFGRFVAREVKHGAWRYTGTPREVAQLRFIELINSMGGDASFARGEGTL